jgi:hypothetical protein
MIGPVYGNRLWIMVYGRIRVPAQSIKYALRSAAAAREKINDHAHAAPS